MFPSELTQIDWMPLSTAKMSTNAFYTAVSRSVAYNVIDKQVRSPPSFPAGQTQFLR